MKEQTINARLLDQILRKSDKSISWLREITAAKLRSAGYIDLGIDVLWVKEDKIRLALSHYVKHESGDMMADPDMEFELVGSELRACTYQNDFLNFFDSVENQEGAHRLEKQRQMDGFATQWLSNLIDQGHRVETVVSG